MHSLFVVGFRFSQEVLLAASAELRMTNKVATEFIRHSSFYIRHSSRGSGSKEMFFSPRALRS